MSAAPVTSDPMVGLHRLFEAVGNSTIDRMCERLAVRLLGVFGSTAQTFGRGQGTPRDLDMCVVFDEDRRTLELLDALSDITGYERLDLAVLNHTNPVLRSEALAGIGLYEQYPGQWATAQMAATAERIDTAWLRRLDLELMAA